MIAAPVIEQHGHILVVRDDLIPGGTKRRVLPSLLKGADEFVYASPACGYAQVALAYACREMGLKATVFTAKRKEMHPRTAEAKAAGAKIVMVPHGYLSNVRSKAAQYAATVDACNLPFGFDTPEFTSLLAEVARSIDVAPLEVWTVAGSGTLCRALQMAWPNATFHAVRVGAEPDVGNANLYQALESFEQDACLKPPFPSCSNYDAKAWRFITERATPGALFWNVAA